MIEYIAGAIRSYEIVSICTLFIADLKYNLTFTFIGKN